MSDFRFKRLESYRTGGTNDRMVLSIPSPRSPSGKIHRCCPVPDCVPNLFQIGDPPTTSTFVQKNQPLIRRTPGTPGLTCPYCGYDGPDDEFVFRGDLKAAQDYIEWAVKQDVGDYFEELARDFNRKVGSGKRGPFSISMKSVRPNHPKPFAWREDLLRDLTCDICARRYGVYALALFCPDCGARNIHVHFGREVELINKQIELANRIEGEGSVELAYRLLGNAHEDVLSVFETYMKTIFRFLVKHRLPDQAKMLSAKKMIGNKFQNIEKGTELFGKIGIDPFQSVSSEDLNLLRLNIEKRHVIGHNLSMADEAYLLAAQTDQPGQTVPLLGEEIAQFANACGKIIIGLEQGCPEFVPQK